jgi:hypothetical protein
MEAEKQWWKLTIDSFFGNAITLARKWLSMSWWSFLSSAQDLSLVLAVHCMGNVERFTFCLIIYLTAVVL